MSVGIEATVVQRRRIRKWVNRDWAQEGLLSRRDGMKVATRLSSPKSWQFTATNYFEPPAGDRNHTAFATERITA
jgi:hypothetical protein